MLNFEENELKYQNLGPINEADISQYEEILNFSFNDNNIFNIGIIGGYGSGKTSLINSYLKQKNKKYMTISLLIDDYNLNNKDKNKEELQKHIRKKILNNLLIQIDSKKIWKTKFKIIRKLDKETIIIICINIFLFILYIILKLKYLIWGLSLFFPLLILNIKKILNYLEFNKIKIKDYSFENNEKDDENYFDKNISEIVYLFENSENTIFIFEDIERLKSNDKKIIFYELRLINNLLNYRNEEIYKFVFSCNETIFINPEDKSKFFDITIPILYKTNKFNAFSRLTDLEQYISNEKIKFLDDLSFYIYDERTIKNIFNEFNIYKSEDKKINHEILAMIIYRNYFPIDYQRIYNDNDDCWIEKFFSLKNELLRIYENQNKDISSIEYIDIYNQQDEICINKVKEFNEKLPSDILEYNDLWWYLLKKEYIKENYINHIVKNFNENNFISENDYKFMRKVLTKEKFVYLYNDKIVDPKKILMLLDNRDIVLFNKYILKFFNESENSDIKIKWTSRYCNRIVKYKEIILLDKLLDLFKINEESFNNYYEKILPIVDLSLLKDIPLEKKEELGDDYGLRVIEKFILNLNKYYSLYSPDLYPLDLSKKINRFRILKNSLNYSVGMTIQEPLTLKLFEELERRLYSYNIRVMYEEIRVDDVIYIHDLSFNDEKSENNSLFSSENYKKFFYKFLEIGNEFGYTKIYVKIINSIPIFLKNINLKKVDDLNYENTYLIDI